MADSLFENDASPTIDESQTYYDKLVGPNAKFKDNESLAKGKWHSDQMIEIQNKKMDQLRADYIQLKADYDARAKLEEYLDKLQNTTNQQTQANENTQNVRTETNAPALKPEDIDTRFRQLRNEEKAQTNLDTVMAKLKEQYADNWSTVLKNKTQELDLTEEEVNAMARRSPKLFFKTMDLEQRPQQQPNQSPPRSDTRFTPQGAPKKTWSYYQELYKKNPKLYYDPKMTQEMVESHASLGKDFEDGDFRKFGDTLAI